MSTWIMHWGASRPLKGIPDFRHPREIESFHPRVTRNEGSPTKKASGGIPHRASKVSADIL